MGAILVRRDVLVVEPNRAEVVALAAQQRLPAMYSFRQFPDSGGLMSYGVNVNDIHRRSATFVDKILKGAKPADLPIEQPTKFELVINLKTAGAQAYDPCDAAGAGRPGHRMMDRRPTSRPNGPGARVARSGR